MLGHDLRNPLNAIMMTTRLLRRIATAPNEINAVERVRTSATADVEHGGAAPRSDAQPDGGRHHARQGARRLCGVVSEVVDELRRAYPEPGDRWAGGAGVHANADRDRLAQVFSNLVGNALEHGDAARPVTVDLSMRREDVALAVHNHGPPIPSDLLPFLFEPFRRTGARANGRGASGWACSSRSRSSTRTAAGSR